jgi:putative sterol carrier protein
VEVTFAQETELDLFTEQCFSPAFGKVLTTAVDLLLEEGYPPEAVLLELYMSGELAYALSRMATMGTIEQSALHSTTSQYGSMSRSMSFLLPGLRERMLEGLDEIRSGAFAREWAAEQAEGGPTLAGLRAMARSLPLHQLETELLQELGRSSGSGIPLARREAPPAGLGTATTGAAVTGAAVSRSLLERLLARVRGRANAGPATPAAGSLDQGQMEAVLRAFLALAGEDAALLAFARDRALTTHYQLSDPDLEFYLAFREGTVRGDLGAPGREAEVRIRTQAGLLDRMLTGRTNAMRAAMTGGLAFEGEARLALSVQQIQADMVRLYSQARARALAGEG